MTKIKMNLHHFCDSHLPTNFSTIQKLFQMFDLNIYFLYNIIFASIQHNMIQWNPEESQITYAICFPNVCLNANCMVATQLNNVR